MRFYHLEEIGRYRFKKFGFGCYFFPLETKTQLVYSLMLTHKKERKKERDCLAFRLIEVFRIDSSWQFHLKMNFLPKSIYPYKKLSQNDENINRQKITRIECLRTNGIFYAQ